MLNLTGIEVKILYRKEEVFILNSILKVADKDLRPAPIEQRCDPQDVGSVSGDMDVVKRPEGSGYIRRGDEQDRHLFLCIIISGKPSEPSVTPSM